MAYRALISIGDFELPQPSTYIGITADLVDSGRNVQGRVIGSLVRSDVAKVEATWNYLTAQQLSDILKAFHPAYGGDFYRSVTFYNQVTADWDTREMYPGDRSTGGAFLLDPDTGAVKGWKGAALHLVEV